MTRDEYMNLPNDTKEQQTAAHRAYCGQYVNEQTKKLVLRAFSFNQLMDSKDPYFNDIQLQRWDRLSDALWANSGGYGAAKKLRENGDWPGLCSGVCILKEAARQIVESAK